jgi:hypothetical protein
MRQLQVHRVLCFAECLHSSMHRKAGLGKQSVSVQPTAEKQLTRQPALPEGSIHMRLLRNCAHDKTHGEAGLGRRTESAADSSASAATAGGGDAAAVAVPVAALPPPPSQSPEGVCMCKSYVPVCTYGVSVCTCLDAYVVCMQGLGKRACRTRAHAHTYTYTH